MKCLLSSAVVAAAVGVAHPAAAQEALLQALRQGLNEEACSESRFAALRQLDEDIRTLEAAAETVRSLYDGPGTVSGSAGNPTTATAWRATWAASPRPSTRPMRSGILPRRTASRGSSPPPRPCCCRT